MKILNIINQILYKGMLILGIILLFFRSYFFGLMLLLLFPLAWFFTRTVDNLKINNKWKTIIYLSIWLHVFGEFYFYTNVWFYDKILHFFVPLFITAMVFEYMNKKNQKLKLEYFYISIFLIVVGMLALFEISEYFIDVLFSEGLKWKMMGVFNSLGEIRFSELNDTMLDLIFGVLGSITYLFFKRRKK